MVTLPYKAELPCCGSKITLQERDDGYRYWLRTCARLNCQTKWYIKEDADGIRAVKDNTHKPKIFRFFENEDQQNQAL